MICYLHWSYKEGVGLLVHISSTSRNDTKRAQIPFSFSLTNQVKKLGFMSHVLSHYPQISIPPRIRTTSVRTLVDRRGLMTIRRMGPAFGKTAFWVVPHMSELRFTIYHVCWAGEVFFCLFFVSPRHEVFSSCCCCHYRSLLFFLFLHGRDCGWVGGCLEFQDGGKLKGWGNCQLFLWRRARGCAVFIFSS
jgi:hypothetical protein